MSVAEKKQILAKKIHDVYEAGKAEGGGGGNTDAFWDLYQNNGNRTDYSHAFGGVGWNKQTLTPKYDIKPTSAYMIFRQCDFDGDLGSLGVELDFSQSTNTGYMFALASKITHIGKIDARNTESSTVFETCFQNCSALKTIDKLVFKLKQGNTAEFSASSFKNCTALENITMEGEITNNGLNLQHSAKLSRASIENIIDCLSKSSSGKAITLSRKAVENAFGSEVDLTLSAKQSDGYKVTFVDGAANTSLRFSAPMNVTYYGLYLMEGEYYDATVSKSGVDSFDMNEEVTLKAHSSDSTTTICRYEGDYTIKIKRADGKDLSEADVKAYNLDEWYEFIFKKDMWTINLL